MLENTQSALIGLLISSVVVHMWPGKMGGRSRGVVTNPTTLCFWMHIEQSWWEAGHFKCFNFLQTEIHFHYRQAMNGDKMHVISCSSIYGRPLCITAPLRRLNSNECIKGKLPCQKHKGKHIIVPMMPVFAISNIFLTFFFYSFKNSLYT